jgi:tetratricopeptide (TPR) repeat protein
MIARSKVLGIPSLALTLCLTSLPAIAGSPVEALVQPPSDDDMTQAKAEYGKGEKAYRLGQFEAAATAFEQAYELSGLPDILYNIGLSHLRWYDTDPDIAHLRKAKVVFQNYVIEIQKNPELGNLEEAEELIKTIDEKVAEHERKAAAEAGGDGDGGDGDGGDGDVPDPVDAGPDPGKKLRLGGTIGMGVGGAFLLGGIVSGVVLGVRGQEFEENLANAYAEREELGCTTGDARSACDDVNEKIDVNRANGRTANSLAVGLGVGFAGVGVGALVTGVVLFLQGNKKTKAWESKQMSLVPTWNRGGAGLSFSGRF